MGIVLTLLFVLTFSLVDKRPPVPLLLEILLGYITFPLVRSSSSSGIKNFKLSPVS